MFTLSSTTTATNGSLAAKNNQQYNNPPDRMVGGALVRRASTVYTTHPTGQTEYILPQSHHSRQSTLLVAKLPSSSTRVSADQSYTPQRGPLGSLMFDEDELGAARLPFAGGLSESNGGSKLFPGTPEVSSLLSSASTLDPTVADFHHELKRFRMKSEHDRRRSSAVQLSDNGLNRRTSKVIENGDRSFSGHLREHSPINTDTTRSTPTHHDLPMEEDGSQYSQMYASDDEYTSSVISVSTTDRDRVHMREEQYRRKQLEKVEAARRHRQEEHEKREELRAEHRKQLIGELPFGLYPGSRLVTPVDRRITSNLSYHQDDSSDVDPEWAAESHDTGFGSDTVNSIISSTKQPMSKKKKAAALVEAQKKETEKELENHIVSQQYEAVAVAQYALKEASRHAISLQDMLLEIQITMEEKESERLRIQHRIEMQIDEGVRMDNTVAGRKLTHEDQLQTLKSRIAYLEQETMTDRDEKIRLLKIIDMYVNGGPTPTLADWSFHHYINTVGQQVKTQPGGSFAPSATAEHRAQFTAASASNAAVSFAKIIGSLPETNRDLLEKQRMFTFSNQVINNATVQYRRSRVVSAERAVLAGAIGVGLNVKLVELLSHIAADDLIKL